MHTTSESHFLYVAMVPRAGNLPWYRRSSAQCGSLAVDFGYSWSHLQQRLQLGQYWVMNTLGFLQGQSPEWTVCHSSGYSSDSIVHTLPIQEWEVRAWVCVVVSWWPCEESATYTVAVKWSEHKGINIDWGTCHIVKWCMTGEVLIISPACTHTHNRVKVNTQCLKCNRVCLFVCYS